ncbi:MAG: hypothetical protein LBS62_05125 [Clostridiales bacterium]|nr:hypothetical protein [Clostridiales bacterium]
MAQIMPVTEPKELAYSAYNNGLAAPAADDVGAVQRAEEAKVCQTCQNRRYQDGSDDPGVSFKSPTKLTPNQAATAVASHENEHYTRETAKAREEGKEVVSASIRIFTDVCPECGRVYVSGGETRVATRQKIDSAQFAKQFYDKNVGKGMGQSLDKRA